MYILVVILSVNFYKNYFYEANKKNVEKLTRQLTPAKQTVSVGNYVVQLSMHNF